MGPPAAHAFRGVVILAAIVTVAAALYDDSQVAQIIRAVKRDPTLSEAAIMESFAQPSALASVPEAMAKRHPRIL